jgi:hypothetical protein
MAVAPLFRLASFAAAKILRKLFGAATMTFFGRAPSQDDDKVALVGLLSLAWLGVIPALFYPPYGQTLLPFLPAEAGLVLPLAIALLVLGGPLIGTIIARTQNRKETGWRLVLTALQGYGYAILIGLLTLALILVVPVVKFSHLLRNLEMEHMAVMIPEDRFNDVEKRVLHILREDGLDVKVEKENPVLAWIFKAIVWTEQKIFRQHMAEQLTLLKGRIDDGPLTVELHPTDIAVRARDDGATYVYTLLAEQIADRHVYLTWDNDAQRIEDRIREARDEAAQGDPVEDEEIEDINERLRLLGVDSGQWNQLRRLSHRLENETLRARLRQRQKRTAETASHSH